MNIPENVDWSAQSKGNKCGRVLRKFDLYSPNFQFLLPDGNSQYQTATGGALCIFFGLIVLIYSLSTGIKLVSREGYNLVELTNENMYRDSDFSFGYDYGFAIAAAITYGNTHRMLCTICGVSQRLHWF